MPTAVNVPSAPLIDGRIGDWIQVYSGRQFWPLDPRPEDISIVDIAHALSMQCRFTGHVKSFYSTAQHSYLVSYLCEPQDALWGLLHDAAEAYICDLSRPIKKHSRLGDEYELIEDRIMKAVAAKFGLSSEQPESVGYADKLMLAIEARDLMGKLQPGWEKWIDRIPPNMTLNVSKPWDCSYAEARFLERYRVLTQGDTTR